MTKCPNCRNPTNELMSCDKCNGIGCSRCIVKNSRQWLCENCRKGTQNAVQGGNQGSSAPAGGFPGWFG